ncbi:hypothetical protein HanXRQr2_Chr03g0095831 [Helianthus annuus]|uniref:Leucine-rich repeat domain, L domain-like protein n=1 Tax=Helianthus annuus TaxID=4232 RepID=A0A9K3NV89_HELAN|nr:hypothetical protein HanXRQr2_Chr03g0095831 [Helianthus annuus]
MRFVFSLILISSLWPDNWEFGRHSPSSYIRFFNLGNLFNSLNQWKRKIDFCYNRLVVVSPLEPCF